MVTPNRLISKNEVEEIAWLARLNLTEEEKEEFTRQFNDILLYFKKMDEVDTSGVEPMFQVFDIHNRLREDEVIQVPLQVDEVLKNAPEKKDQYFKAPRIL